jgi:hypothetical protein
MRGKLLRRLVEQRLIEQRLRRRVLPPGRDSGLSIEPGGFERERELAGAKYGPSQLREGGDDLCRGRGLLTEEALSSFGR